MQKLLNNQQHSYPLDKTESHEFNGLYTIFQVRQKKFGMKCVDFVQVTK